jgi:hypothetical protein
MASKRQIEAEIKRVLHAIRAVPEDDRERRTVLLRDLAEATVSYREHFVLSGSGATDWTGATYAYRKEIGELYTEAGYPQAEAKAIQKLARYHIANTLRERLSPSEIEAIGLRAELPRERQTELRARSAAIVAAAAVSAVQAARVPETAEERIAYLHGVLATLKEVGPLSAAEKGREDYVSQYRTAKKLLDQIVRTSRSIAKTWPAPEGEDPTIA